MTALPRGALQTGAETKPSGRDLLRFLTCGSVDDGKSTLIGRLLVDAGLVPGDQYAAAKRASGGAIDYAFLLDGLEAEREQGITIDVAYRYFTTPRRSFIVADSPGHEQFTRNMAVGASVSDLAVLLVDARKGLLMQTRRHATIATLMGIRQVVLAVNKMDLVDYDERVFNAVFNEFRTHAEKLGVRTTAIPLSALKGENVVHRAPAMPWYDGPTLLEFLETAEAAAVEPEKFSFPVQRVSRPNSEFRGYQGTLTGGRVRVGDPIVAVPSGQTSRVRRIATFDGDLEEAGTGEAITLVLADEIEAGRGTILAHPEATPVVVENLTAHLVWMGDAALDTSRGYLMRTPSALVPARVSALRHRFDVVQLTETPAETLAKNDIGLAAITVERPIALERYTDNRDLGSFILIDRLSNETVAAGMVVEPIPSAQNVFWQKFDISRVDRVLAQGQTPAILWITGPSGAGKSTAANLVEGILTRAGHHAYVLDGDNVRHGLNRDLGFSAAERTENIRRIAEVARILADAGLLVIVAAISPFARDRAAARATAAGIPFYEVFVDTPLEICAARDPKGLYRRARDGKLDNFTGIGAPYERPQAPDLHLYGAGETPLQEAEKLIELLGRMGHIRSDVGV
jgi:bifunctional enzyme CysN/CysC